MVFQHFVWIPISEKKPDSFGTFLISCRFCSSFSVHVAYYDNSHDRWTWFDGTSFHRVPVNREIVAWAPFPYPLEVY